MTTEAVLAVGGILGVVLVLAIVAAVIGRRRARRWQARPGLRARGAGSVVSRTLATGRPASMAEGSGSPRLGVRRGCVPSSHPAEARPTSTEAGDGVVPWAPLEPTRIVPRRIAVSGALEARRRAAREAGLVPAVEQPRGVEAEAGERAEELEEWRLVRRLRLVRDTALLVLAGSLVGLVALLWDSGFRGGVAGLTGTPPATASEVPGGGLDGSSGPTSSLVPPVTGTPPTAVPSPTGTLGTATAAPTPRPTAQPTTRPTRAPTRTPATTATSTPTRTPIPSPTGTPSSTAVPTPTSTSTASSSPSPSLAPTPSTTPAPTVSPSPTSSPEPSPSPSPTAEPPSPSPSPEP